MKWTLALAVFLAATGPAAAQDSPTPKSAKTTHGAPRAARPLPVIIPQQFAPPQEAYASFPETAGAAAQATVSECQGRLKKIALFQPLPVLVGPGECGATDAVSMDAIILPDQSKVAVTPPGIMRCPMAEEIAHWVREDVVPTLKNMPPLRVLDNFDSYSCRGRNRVRAAQLSEHGKADALDVRAFKLADGRSLDLTDVNVDKDFRETIKSSVCSRFMTVLGPGSDGYHEQHIHLDLEPRRNNYKICEWDVRVPPPPPEAQKEANPPSGVTSTASGDTSSQEDQVALIPPDMVPLPRPRPKTADRAAN